MISRNTGRTASRGNAPFAAAVSRCSTARSRCGTWNASRRSRLRRPTSLDDLGAPVEQRQDLIVDAVDRRAQRREIVEFGRRRASSRL